MLTWKDVFIFLAVIFGFLGVLFLVFFVKIGVWLWLLYWDARLFCSVVGIILLYQTIRWYKRDIYAGCCQDFYWHKIAADLNDDDAMDFAFRENGPRWNYIQDMQPIRFLFAPFAAPHHCKPLIIYSDNTWWKVTITHIRWDNYIVYQKHAFDVEFEKVA